MKIFDTHAHLYFPGFDEDLDQTIENARKAGVAKQIQIGCDEIATLAAIDLAEKYKDFYATVGIHPADVLEIGKPATHRYSGYTDYKSQNNNLDDFFVWLEKVFLENKDLIVGFGETGFDLYHNDSAEIFDAQVKAFLKHLELAGKYDRTLVIHTRNAREETLDFLRKNVKGKNIRGVIHCFSEDVEFAKEVIEDYGFMIGIGGVATYKNADNVREVIREIPLEFMITETDAPFLTPHNFRKKFKRNEPAFLTEVVELIADLKNMSTEDCANILFENALRTFRIKD